MADPVRCFGPPNILIHVTDFGPDFFIEVVSQTYEDPVLIKPVIPTPIRFVDADEDFLPSHKAEVGGKVEWDRQLHELAKAPAHIAAGFGKTLFQPRPAGEGTEGCFLRPQELLPDTILVEATPGERPVGENPRIPQPDTRVLVDRVPQRGPHHALRQAGGVLPKASLTFQPKAETLELRVDKPEAADGGNIAPGLEIFERFG